MTWSTDRKILNLHRDLGIEQQELAELAGITPSATSEIERMEFGRNPRAEVLRGVARALWVTADYLLEESAPYPPTVGEDAPKVERPREMVEMRASAEGRAHLRAMRNRPVEALRVARAVLAAGERGLVGGVRALGEKGTNDAREGNGP